MNEFNIQESPEDHIIMQLRSALDVGGNKEISFRRGASKVDVKSIKKILKLHDSLPKPDDKRRLRVAIIKSKDDLEKVAKMLPEEKSIKPTTSDLSVPGTLFCQHINEKLAPSMGLLKYINDFQDSGSPKFDGMSKEKRKEMAVAAYLAHKRQLTAVSATDSDDGAE